MWGAVAVAALRAAVSLARLLVRNAVAALRAAVSLSSFFYSSDRLKVYVTPSLQFCQRGKFISIRN